MHIAPIWYSVNEIAPAGNLKQMVSRFRDVEHFCFQLAGAEIHHSRAQLLQLESLLLTPSAIWTKCTVSLEIVSFPFTNGTNTFGIGFHVFLWLLSANVTLCCTYLHAGGFFFLSLTHSAQGKHGQTPYKPAAGKRRTANWLGLFCKLV